MSKRKVSVEDKIYAVNLYLDGKESQRRIADMFDVSLASIQQWIRNYESMGANAFTLKGNKKYSKELKQQAVLDYLAGYGSQDDICKKYGIRSKAKLQIWIKKYNGHEELKSSGTGGSIIMTKGRKTTFEERVEIVQYCIAHDRNYAQTAEQYQVSYQQARNYIVKYEAGGVEAFAVHFFIVHKRIHRTVHRNPSAEHKSLIKLERPRLQSERHLRQLWTANR